jgi:UDP-N-acetylglucosamine--dolichyl-phosphate N-acetylglucosaminephosphotransferase
MLAGYNGLEAGMGAIILGTMGLIAWRTGSGWVAMLAISAFFALLAFLVYNWYPAKVFPGDTLTYSIGALIACVAILGNMEKIAIVLFIPYFLDFLLPLRKKLHVEAFAKVNRDNSLEMPYRGIYDMTHLGIFVVGKVKSKVFERDVVVSILALEVILAVLTIVVF